jgi:hypothetical protein
MNPADNLTYLTCSYPRRFGALDLVYTLEMSVDLSAWSSPPAQMEEVSIVPNPDNVTETVTVRIKPAVELSQRNFIRVRVTFQ